MDPYECVVILQRIARERYEDDASYVCPPSHQDQRDLAAIYAAARYAYLIIDVDERAVRIWRAGLITAAEAQ